MSQQSDVLIVGIGPVGAMTGLLLANRGFNVTIIEKESHVADSPRALVYLPPTIATLEEAGIMDEVRDAGLTPNGGLAWRKASDQSLLAAVDPTALKGDDPFSSSKYSTILLGQHVLARIILEKLQSTGRAKVYFDCAFQEAKQDGQRVLVTVEDCATKQKHEHSVSFVLGTDGAHSRVRKGLDVAFEGFTHPMSCMSINLRYPQMQATGFGDVQFVVDPAKDIEDSRFAIILRAGQGDVWRCFYGDGTHHSEEELKARVSKRLKDVLPLHPNPNQYEILLAQPYHIHQRCASTYVKGRILLAGDAAHINNPAGGLGLNTGLADARVAADILTKALKMSDEEQVNQALKEYNDTRRTAFLDSTNPLSTDNLRRLWEASDEADEKLRTEFWAKMRTPDFQREMQLSMFGFAKGVPGL